MKAEFVIYFLFVIYSSTDSFVISSNSSDLASESNTSSLNITECDEDLDFSNTPCMTDEDHVKIWNGLVHYGLARSLNDGLISTSIEIIGREELRKVLNMSLQLKPHNETEPSEEEIESAPTLEAYFDLKEQQLDLSDIRAHERYHEHNFQSAIKFLGERYPEIRAHFRCRFEKLRPIDKVVDRSTIDLMNREYSIACEKINKAVESITNTFCSFFREKGLRNNRKWSI